MESNFEQGYNDIVHIQIKLVTIINHANFLTSLAKSSHSNEMQTLIVWHTYYAIYIKMMAQTSMVDGLSFMAKINTTSLFCKGCAYGNV
jgi:hypothetical protein